MSQLNDPQIRAAYHQRRLARHHANPDVVVVDELGIQHGRCRADIAVINGHLAGFEIKSDVDSLMRLQAQVDGYNAVFDRVSLVVTERHLSHAEGLIPDWWGLVSASQGSRGAIHFSTVRRARRNDLVDDFAVAQLIWREEAKEILLGLGMDERELRGNRATLYGHLLNRLSSHELRDAVRQKMKNRQAWRGPSSPSSSGG